MFYPFECIELKKIYRPKMKIPLTYNNLIFDFDNLMWYTG